jgi:vancomycin resistance protein YoaR
MSKDIMGRDKHSVGVAVAVLGLLLLLSAVMLKEDVVAGNVWVLGEFVGGMPRDEALDLVQEKMAEISSSPVLFTAGELSVELSPQEMRAILDIDKISETIDDYVEPRSKLLPAFLLRTGPRSVLASQTDPVDEEVYQVLEKVASSLTFQPQPAYYGFEGRELKVFPPKDGQKVTVDAVLTAIRGISGTTVEVPFELVPAPPNTLDELTLISEFSTPYDLQETDRNINLVLAAGAVHNQILEPNEVYSFNETAGERTVEKGYKYANVVVGDSLVPGLAGGICQVTTTLFNAAAIAGLEFPAICAHAIPVEYVEPGHDAAVAWDYLDFKIRNTTDSTIVFGAWVSEGQVTVRVFGKDSINTFELETEVLEEYPEPGKNPGLLVDTFLVKKVDDKVVERSRIMRSRYLATTPIAKEGE